MSPRRRESSADWALPSVESGTGMLGSPFRACSTLYVVSPCRTRTTSARSRSSGSVDDGTGFTVRPRDPRGGGERRHVDAHGSLDRYAVAAGEHDCDGQPGGEAAAEHEL